MLDGVFVCVLMDLKEVEKCGIELFGVFCGFVVVGCEFDEMGIGFVFVVFCLLECYGMKVDDIDLWELNEVFVS